MIRRIISGFQSGVDINAILAARSLNIPTGGYIPKGFKTENGPKPEYKEYGAIETKTEEYNDRTIKNILKADCTIIFYESVRSRGTKLTYSLCEKFKKPYMMVNIKKPAEPISIVKWLEAKNHDVINIAGHRESVSPGIGDFVLEYLPKVLKFFVKSDIVV